MMQIKGTEGYAPIQTGTARRLSGASRTAAQDGYYDHFTVSAPAAQDRSSFREMVASLSCQVSAGEYQVEPRETAARMLLLMEEGE